MGSDSNNEVLDVLLVGAGFAGLYLLHRLRRAGFNVKVVEAGSDLGGVWHWNGYPGARVDTHAPMYEFSARELWSDWNWNERFPGVDELRRYFVHVDKIWDLKRDVQLGTRIASARFNEERREWAVVTSDGATIHTRYFVPCTGFASKPYIPAIPGIQTFKGTCVHSALWPQGGLDLKNRRVIVIGTGASGVQVTQEAFKVASSVTVMQRTPILALPMQQKQLTPELQAQEKEKYPERFVGRRETFGGFDMDFIQQNALDLSASEREATYDRLWSTGGLHFWLANFQDVLMNEAANRTAYDFWRERTRVRIRKPELLHQLAPSEPPHPFGVKRPSLEQDYYEAFNEDHVGLVNLKQTPITHITAAGVATTEKFHEADIIVLATGFDAVTGGITAIDIRGTSGTSIGDYWSSGVKTHLGISCAGFPNLLMMYGPQSPAGFLNGPTSAEAQGDWLVDLLRLLREKGHTRIETTSQAEAQWNSLLEDLVSHTLFPRADSWYMGANIPGKKRQILNYPGGLPDYLKRCNESLSTMNGFHVR